MDTSRDTIIRADCLDTLKYWYNKGHNNFIDLTYIDPPFNSKRDYNILYDDGLDLTEKAFSDIWSRTKYTDELENLNKLNPNLYSFLKLLEGTNLPKAHLSYLTIMGITCWYIREMLKPTGSFYYHCDPTMSHYVKIMLDYVFGGGNFRNEIVWERVFNTGSSKAISNSIPKNHDIILFYTKSENYTFNKTISEFSDVDKEWRFPEDDNDGKGPYFWGSLKSYSQKRVSVLRSRNELRESKKEGVKYKYTYKVYLKDHIGGTIIPDVWCDIPPIQPNGPENRKYPTQKPEALLERIIKASTNPTDLVADFFMGGGTTVATAAKLGRRYLGVDINGRAIQLVEDRLADQKKESKKDFLIQGMPKSSKALKNMLEKNQISTLDFQDMICKYYLNIVNVIPSEKKSGDDSIDGVFGFLYQNKQRKGYVQVTTSANKNHLKAFCLQVSKQKPNGADMGVYISFKEKITSGMIIEAKEVGKFGSFDKVQILTVEELVDKGKQFELPKDILTI